MAQRIGAISLVVPDYDEAINFYVGVLGFDLIEDVAQSADKRWVVVRPKGARETSLLLARAANDDQRHAVGAQAGGRVFLFLETDNFDADHARLKDAGVEFLEAPRVEPYGKVAVFRDRFGNKWDLIERSAG